MDPGILLLAPPPPGAGDAFRDKIQAIESELDTIWHKGRARGGWRSKEPFDKVEPKLKARIKWLLKRRDCLLHGRDWEVEIVTPDPRRPGRCFAVAIEPRTVAPPASTTDPESPVVFAMPSASELAYELRVPLEHVETALPRCPPSMHTAEKVRAWVLMASDTMAKIDASRSGGAA